MNKQQLVDVLSARTGTPRAELTSKSIQELEEVLNESYLQQIRAEAANSPAVLEAQQKIAEINHDRQRMAQEHQLTLIFHTPVNGRMATDDQANRSIIAGWVDETRGEAPSPAWFVQVLKENPILAGQLSWQSADLLDPVRRKQAESAQAQEDREIFEQAARDTEAFSINDANFNLLRERYSPLDAYQIKLVAEAGLLLGLVSPPTEEEIKTWRREKAEARKDYLINHASPSELRATARQEAEQRRIEHVRAEDARQVAAREQKDKDFGFPPLPETNQVTGEKLTSAYFIKLSNTDIGKFRNYIRVYGASQITKALRERI